MKNHLIKLSDQDLEDLYKAIVIAMKELDKYKNGSDALLSERLDVINKNIENQVNQS